MTAQELIDREQQQKELRRGHGLLRDRIQPVDKDW
jgi:hypothetical protein